MPYTTTSIYFYKKEKTEFHKIISARLFVCELIYQKLYEEEEQQQQQNNNRTTTTNNILFTILASNCNSLFGRKRTSKTPTKFEERLLA